jgi:hypothetical protein
MIVSRRSRWAGLVARTVKKRNAYGSLLLKPEGKRLVGRPRRRLASNNRMYSRDMMGWQGLDWFNSG